MDAVKSDTENSSEKQHFGQLARAAGRLAAVQALYQMEITGIDVTEVIAEFLASRMGQEIDGEQYAEADTALFASLVRGVVSRQEQIDHLLAGALSADWPLPRLDSTLRALLRAAVCELLAHPDTPVKVVLSQYLDIAHAFFSGSEPSFANAVLDHIARDLRPDGFNA